MGKGLAGAQARWAVALQAPNRVVLAVTHFRGADGGDWNKHGAVTDAREEILVEAGFPADVAVVGRPPGFELARPDR